MTAIVAVLICLSALLVGMAVAQPITITEQDIRQQMAVGKSVVNHSDTLTTSVNIGSKGASSWDFSGLLSHTSTPLLSVNPATTPHIASFPGADFALETELSVLDITGTAYIYFDLDTNLLTQGIRASKGTLLGTLVYHRTHTPSDITYALPSTFGTTWSSVYSVREIITLGSSTISESFNNHDAKFIVDAYGPMTLPGGYTEDALRIHRVDSTSNWEATFYIFLAKSGASVQIVASEALPPDTGVISVSEVTWNGPAPTGVEVSEGIPTEFTLHQNFPNPFNPSTTIRYGLPSRSHVTLTVYSTLGQHVATLQDGEEEAGFHESVFDASVLASGMYIYRLQVRPLDSAIGRDSKSGAGAIV